MVNLKKFKDLFVSEIEDHLQRLNDNLLELEKIIFKNKKVDSKKQKKLLDELMNSSHNIKGSAATMGYIEVAFLTHVMEDVFDYSRNNIVKLNKSLINELFLAIDELERAVENIKETGKEINLSEFSKKIKKITGVSTMGLGKSLRAATGEPIIAKGNTKKKLSEEILQVKNNIGIISYIKVPVDRLDNLMNLVKELLIDKMRLERFKKKNPEAEEIVDHLNRLVLDIQYQVMQVRLVPLDQIFARFPRMIRDLAEKQKKKIDFKVFGSEMELDRTIIDKLGDPLTHILRNAVDHGIPGGKSAKKYNIFLTAKREKDYSIISVEDNGVGIDFDGVKKSAIQRNIVSLKEAETLNNNQIISLLFHPRLSTSEVVTEISGRGIGLNIVKNFCDTVGGRTIVESPLSNEGGTRVTLELPLTLAIIRSLLVEVLGSIFCIPFSSIERSVIVSVKDIKSMADQDVAIVGNKNIPLVRLERIFNLKKEEKKEEEEEEEEEEEDNLRIVIVKRGKDKAGIVVDKLIDEQEITAKPLPSILRSARWFSGSTILGDGRTVLILDVVALLEDTKKLVRTI